MVNFELFSIDLKILQQRRQNLINHSLTGETRFVTQNFNHPHLVTCHIRNVDYLTLISNSVIQSKYTFILDTFSPHQGSKLDAEIWFDVFMCL